MTTLEKVRDQLELIHSTKVFKAQNPDNEGGTNCPGPREPVAADLIDHEVHAAAILKMITGVRELNPPPPGTPPHRIATALVNHPGLAESLDSDLELSPVLTELHIVLSNYLARTIGGELTLDNLRLNVDTLTRLLNHLGGDYSTDDIRHVVSSGRIRETTGPNGPTYSPAVVARVLSEK